jgi:hypothetical protein
MLPLLLYTSATEQLTLAMPTVLLFYQVSFSRVHLLRATEKHLLPNQCLIQLGFG